MHNTNNSSAVKLDKWHDDNIAVDAVALVLVVEVVIIVVARRNGHIMQIDLDYNADRTSYEYMTPMKTNSKMKTKQKKSTKIIN